MASNFYWICQYIFMNMEYLLLFVFVIVCSIFPTNSEPCKVACPPGNNNMECGFDVLQKKYRMFPSKCALDAYSKCYTVELKSTPLKFCVKNHMITARRTYGESCPVFCPSHYRPVCGASKLRDYIYKTFTNGCYLDMINCRGDEEFSGYVEVPLEYCQRHLTKNIFRDQVVVSNLHDYMD